VDNNKTRYDGFIAQDIEKASSRKQWFENPIGATGSEVVELISPESESQVAI
jgi:hypothetical protein